MKFMNQDSMKVSDGNYSTEIPTVVAGEMTPEVMSSSGGMSKKRKCVIIAIVTVVMLVIVAAATLIGVKFYLDSKVQTEQIRLEYGRVTIDEKSLYDEYNKNQLMTYKIEDKNNNLTMWVISDMNRGIQVMKTVAGDAKMCTVTPLDIIARASPTGQHISNMSLNSTDAKDVVVFNLSEYPIMDTSVIGYYGEQLCQGIAVYWAYPRCPTTSSQTNGDSGANAPSKSRKRRAYCYYRQCRYTYSNCYYTSYANDGRKYYTCSCTYQYMYYSC